MLEQQPVYYLYHGNEAIEVSRTVYVTTSLCGRLVMAALTMAMMLGLVFREVTQSGTGNGGMKLGCKSS